MTTVRTGKPRHVLVRVRHYRPGATAVAVATLLAVSTASASADPVADPIGPSCAVYAPGAARVGSLADAAQQPLSVAVSNNPKLSAVNAALSGKLNPAVNLLDTLNGGQVTIFAPVDNAFSRLPPRRPPRCKPTPHCRPVRNNGEVHKLRRTIAQKRREQFELDRLRQALQARFFPTQATRDGPARHFDIDITHDGAW